MTLLLVTLLMLAGTYMQVRTPDLIGQTVDCYLTPATAQTFDAGSGGSMGNAASANCWFDDVPADATTRQLAAGLGKLTTKPAT